MSERRCERLTLGRIRKFDVAPPWLRQASPRISNAAPFRRLRPSDWHRRIHIVAEQVLLATKCRFALFSARLRKLKRLYTASFRFARSNTHAHHNTRFEKQAERDADFPRNANATEGASDVD
jgi:hypothetical protein